MVLGVGGAKKDRELKGYIDELYIFNRTLAEEELAQIHDRCKGPMSAKVLHLDFENTTRNFTYDTSYQGNDGYLTGQVLPGKIALRLIRQAAMNTPKAAT